MSESDSTGTAQDGAAQASPRTARWRKLWVWGLLLVVAAGAYYCATHAGRGAPNLTVSFSGDSRELARTQIVPTLDTPIEPGKNVVWCATFLAGWKQLQQNVVKGPVQVSGAEDVCARLNAAADPAQHMPPEVYYANAGTEDKGILQTIEKDMEKKFPNHQVPEFELIEPGGFVLYSYLEARVPFPVPFFDNREELSFADSRDEATGVRSFGIRKEDYDLYSALRSQARLLMAKWPEKPGQLWVDEPPTSFAVDLCGESSPCQILVAVTERRDTLTDTLSNLDAAIQAYGEAHGDASSLGSSDVLLVPDMFWRLEHHLAELEKRQMESSPIEGQEVTIALQEIRFRLDRSGAELSSEARGYPAASEPIQGLHHYICDRPFLVIMRQRGSDTPFFVMWVDNADLLQAWDS